MRLQQCWVRLRSWYDHPTLLADHTFTVCNFQTISRKIALKLNVQKLKCRFIAVNNLRWREMIAFSYSETADNVPSSAVVGIPTHIQYGFICWWQRRELSVSPRSQNGSVEWWLIDRDRGMVIDRNRGMPANWQEEGNGRNLQEYGIGG